MAQALVRWMAAQHVEIDGIEQRFFAGIWAIFGHGNVAGMGEALAAVESELPTFRAHNEQGMAHAAIALGTLTGGWRIVHTMGSKITKLQPIGGFAAETAGAITLFAASALGVPVSTTHTITGAIVGVAKVDPMPRATGQWNVYEITAKGDTFTVILNGKQTVVGKDAKHAKGNIGLQHGLGNKDAAGVVNDKGVVKFRKLEIKPL